VRIANVTTLCVEGKQKLIFCKAKSSTQEMRQRATKYCRWGVLFIAWAVIVTLRTTSHELPFTSNGLQTHRFARATVLRIVISSVNCIM
jgi:hypothetical protein